MNPRSRKAALYTIGVIAIAASVNALAHSYAGLYDWALHHRLTGWQAMSWPAEIDVFLAVGELALYVAYLDGWPARQRIWPWVTALVGLTVSIAGNIGHIQAGPGHPVILADRLTAATSPIAAFAGLAIGLLVLKMTRQQAGRRVGEPGPRPVLMLASHPANAHAPAPPGHPAPVAVRMDGFRQVPDAGHAGAVRPDPGVVRDATVIAQRAAARGERLSQRGLARQLRRQGHHFPNDHLRQIALSIGLPYRRAA